MYTNVDYTNDYTYYSIITINNQYMTIRIDHISVVYSNISSMAGVRGIEPRFQVLETYALTAVLYP